MSTRCFALLIHQRVVPFDSLKYVLKELGIATSSVASLEEARRLIPQTEPHLIFTDTTLSDGSWTDTLNLAEGLALPSSVIVVSAISDMKLYWVVLDRGAYDFIMPPFERGWLDLIVHRAADAARRRRFAQARAAAA